MHSCLTVGFHVVIFWDQLLYVGPIIMFFEVFIAGWNEICIIYSVKSLKYLDSSLLTD